MTAVSELLRSAEDHSRKTLHSIEASAKFLAHQMRIAHGGEWRIQIDHESEFVMIVRRSRT